MKPAPLNEIEQVQKSLARKGIKFESVTRDEDGYILVKYPQPFHFFNGVSDALRNIAQMESKLTN